MDSAESTSDVAEEPSAETSVYTTNIELDYGFTSRSRWGHGRPQHRRLTELFERGRTDYATLLRSIASFHDDFMRIPVTATEDPTEPSWFNGWLPSLDTMVLYGLLASRNPKMYLEIGSGNSTKFARRAIQDHQLRTKIVSIDPHPRAECDLLCDEVLRQPFEDVDITSVLGVIGPNDIVFLDGSHRSFMNSDTTAFFLDLLPELPPGTYVHIHDVLLPADYSPDWIKRYYNEQYLLAAWLLAGGTSYDVFCPNYFISQDRELHGLLEGIWSNPAMSGAEDWGVSFWLRRTESPRSRMSHQLLRRFSRSASRGAS
jgi:hypothetical protein